METKPPTTAQLIKKRLRSIELEALEMVKNAKKGGNYYNNLAQIQAMQNDFVTLLMGQCDKKF